MKILYGSKYSYIAASAANIICILTGASMAWSSPTLPILEGDDFDRNPLDRIITGEESSWIGSLATLGGMIGPLVFCYLAEKVGRKTSLLLLSIPFAIAFFTAAFAEIIELFYVARIFMGMGIGAMFCVIPIYMAEIAENSNRGFLQALVSSNMTIGMLFSYCVGPYISIMAFNLILACTSILFVPVFWIAAPESPYYLVSAGKEDVASKALCYLRHKPDTKEELQHIKTHYDQLTPGSFLDIFKTKGTTKAFLYCAVFITFQQFSGISVILYYNQNIFSASGSDLPAEVCSIIVGGAQFFVSLLTPFFMDKLGRKILLLNAITGTIIGEVLLGVYFYLQKNGDDVSDLGWLPILSLTIFIVFYNLGMSSIPWALLGELLPSNIISLVASIITSFYWFVGFFLTRYFADLSEKIGMAGSFWFFAGFGVCFDLFTFFFLFETKGKSLKEIQEILNK